MVGLERQDGPSDCFWSIRRTIMEIIKDLPEVFEELMGNVEKIAVVLGKTFK